MHRVEHVTFINKVKGTLEFNGERIFFTTPFNNWLKDEIKMMEDAKWDPKARKWHVKDSYHNQFQLAYLLGKNPYERFDAPFPDIPTLKRDNIDGNTYAFFLHQMTMYLHAKFHNQAIFAAEMGTGKTLPAIQVIEESGTDDWFWISSRIGLVGAQVEIRAWKSKIRPKMFTYTGLVNILKSGAHDTPFGVVFDESAAIKNATSQRSQAALSLGDFIRQRFGPKNARIIEMTGTPAPKEPTDWWHQCKVACPGFIREGDFWKFRNRLGWFDKKENDTGGSYPVRKTWWDNEELCKHCGEIHIQPADEFEALVGPKYDHAFEPSINEVSFLNERLKGLVTVHFLEDCIDLPELQYYIYRVKPDEETLRAAKILAATRQAGKRRAYLRELSDGFQYVDTKIGEKTCEVCHGSGKYQGIELLRDGELTEDGMCVGDFDTETGEWTNLEDLQEGVNFKWADAQCPECVGTGIVDLTERDVREVESPKMDGLKDLLEMHEQDGRLVIYAAFQGSIDRIAKFIEEQGWIYFRIDGRGTATNGHFADTVDAVTQFQSKDGPERMVYLGHPKSAGESVTLHRSRSIIFYSNDDDGGARTQAEYRIHRAGMDKNRGARIIDLIHLPTDLEILKNAKHKRRLETLSMGRMMAALDVNIKALEYNQLIRVKY